MLRALIVEDEPLNREVLKNLLGTYCPDITVVGEAMNVASAIQTIRALTPDIVFLDIELGDGTAFDVLTNLGNAHQFRPIFTTAFDHYAVQAIRFNAIDYLLKPIDPDELQSAVARADKAGPQPAQNLEHFISNLNTRNENPIITLSTSDSYEYIPVREIIRCEAQGAYTRFVIRNKPPLLVSKTLKEYEPLLSPYNFFRTHQSHLINMQEVERYLKGDGGYVMLKDGTKIGVARTRRDEFLQAMQTLREL